MKLETGRAKGRDLPFGCENYLRILEGIFNIVLLQNVGREDTMGWAGRNPAMALSFRSELGTSQQPLKRQRLSSKVARSFAVFAIQDGKSGKADQMVGSTRGDSESAEAVARVLLRHRTTASVETIAREIQMRRKVMKCSRVNGS